MVTEKVARVPGAVVATSIAFTAAAWGLVAYALWPIYRDPAMIVLAAAAITAALVIGVAAAVSRWPAWGVILAASSVFLVTGVPLAVPSRTVYGVLPEPAGVVDLLAGIALGWRQLVTIDLPVGTYQALLVPALVVLLAGSLISITIALRTTRGELAAVPPVLGYLLALALGAERVETPVASGVTLTLVVLLWMAVWRRHRRRAAIGVGAGHDPSRWGFRTVGAALVLLLVAGASAAALVSAVSPHAERTVIRTFTERPFEPLEQPSPLAAYRASFDPQVAELPVVTVDGAPAGARIRLAVLDSYDGVVFAVGSDQVNSDSGRFVRVPTARDVLESQGRPATMQFTMARSTGVWLPIIGEFITIDFSGDASADVRDEFVYNAATNAAALVGGTSPGLAYRIDAVVTDGAASLTHDSIPGDAAVPGIIEIPDALRDWLDGVTASRETPGARLQAAISALRVDGYLSHGVSEDEAVSRPGHSLDRINELLTRRPMVGDAEQYAVTAALAARELGFPSRIVLGFGPLDGSASATLLESERTAWIEVSTATDGWVALDVVPDRREVPPDEPSDPVPVSRPQNAPQPPVDDAPTLDERAPPEIEQSDRDDLDPFWQAVLAVVSVLAWIALVAGLLSTPLVAIALLKLRRRRRRRSAPDPTMRIIGGWMEVIDGARDAGYPVSPIATRSESATALQRPSALILARVADRAVYAPEQPSDREADQVWQVADELRTSMISDMTRRRRWRAVLSTASLRRYSGPRRVTTRGR